MRAFAAPLRSRRVVVEWGTPFVAALCLFLVGVFVFRRLDQSYDLRIFVSAGRDVLAGRNPWPTTTSEIRANRAFAYPLFSAWLFTPLTLLSPSAAYIVYTALSAVALGVGMALLDMRRLSTTFLVGLSAFAVRSVTLGTVEPLLFLCLAVAWCKRDSPVWAGSALGIGMMIKPVLAPVFLFFLLTSRFRATAIGIGTAAALWVPFSGASLSTVVGYVRMVHRVSTIEGPGSMSLGGRTEVLGLGHGGVLVLLTVLSVLGIVAVCLMGRSASTEIRDRASYCMAVTVCVVVSQIVWSHYFLFVFVGVVVAQPVARWAVVAFFAASWFVTPDGKWWFSPSHLLGGIGHNGYWLAQGLIGVALSAALAALLTEHRIHPVTRPRWLSPSPPI